jgi:hypothetical protein
LQVVRHAARVLLKAAIELVVLVPLAIPEPLTSRLMNARYACPCCGHRTLDERPPGTYDICPVCFWEDDPVQYDDPDYEGGANRPSLRQAQANFLRFGASEERRSANVRKPTSAEERPDDWQPLPQAGA